MPQPLTADERERRLVQYLFTLHKGQLGEYRLTRLNRAANFRKQIRELIEEFVEARAEELAAGMIERHAPERAPTEVRARKERVKQMRARQKPVWMIEEGKIWDLYT
jgi:hypothetical protein